MCFLENLVKSGPPRRYLLGREDEDEDDETEVKTEADEGNEEEGGEGRYVRTRITTVSPTTREDS